MRRRGTWAGRASSSEWVGKVMWGQVSSRRLMVNHYGVMYGMGALKAAALLAADVYWDPGVSASSFSTGTWSDPLTPTMAAPRLRIQLGVAHDGPTKFW